MSTTVSFFSFLTVVDSRLTQKPALGIAQLAVDLPFLCSPTSGQGEWEQRPRTHPRTPKQLSSISCKPPLTYRTHHVPTDPWWPLDSSRLYLPWGLCLELSAGPWETAGTCSS